MKAFARAKRSAGAADGAELARRFGSRLVTVRPPALARVRGGAAADLHNPYAIEDEPGAYHTTGWLSAFESRHSPYAVAVETAADIAAAVRFARDRGIRLAVKGTGHDYLGRSSRPGSLLVWTHAMREILVHDAFIPAGGERGFPAVTIGAGARWLEVYQALAGHGRVVTGGGCTTVGAVGGFTQGGGFGSFSRRFGTAAGNVLEIEVVTADGEILVANSTQHRDLFWALRGGGGGTFGIVSKMTFLTHPSPGTVSVVSGAIRASNSADYRRLVGAVVRQVPELDYRWGEQISFGPDNSVRLMLLASGLDADEARAVWQPVLDWADRHPQAYESGIDVASIPFRQFWDYRWWQEYAPQAICRDTRPGQAHGNFWWAANQGEVSWYLDAYKSRWIPASQFGESPDILADALVSAARIWPFAIHLNKGLSQVPPGIAELERATSVNPAACDAAALLIAASAQQNVFPGVPGHEPDLVLGAARAGQVGAAVNLIREITPGSGSYVNETDYFEPDWQRSFWGVNYPRLLAIKQKYDPAGVFLVHHGVGSERGRRRRRLLPRI